MKVKQANIVLLIFICVLGWPWLSGTYGITYEYDHLNRLTRVIYDEAKSIEYTYDAAGNRTRLVSTLLADTFIDGRVDFRDYAVLASRWLEDCVYPDWCNRADIDWSSRVDIEDLAVLARQWLDEM